MFNMSAKMCEYHDEILILHYAKLEWSLVKSIQSHIIQFLKIVINNP